MFNLDRSEYRKLMRFYRGAPKQFGYASAGMLNTFAFNTRKEALKIIHKDMQVRNQSFVVSRLRFKRTSGRTPVKDQQSETFSIKGPRFSGWVEQETGAKTERTRIATALGRGGSETGQIRPVFRLKPGRDFLSPDDFSGKNNQQRLAAMLRHIEQEKYRKPFVIKGSRKFRPGLYKQQRRKLRRLQEFKARNAQPKRVRWMTKARRNNFKTLDIRAEWAKNINKQLKYT